MAWTRRDGSLYPPAGSRCALVSTPGNNLLRASLPARRPASFHALWPTGLVLGGLCLLLTLLSGCRPDAVSPTPSRPALIYPTDTPALVVVDITPSPPVINPTLTPLPTASPTPVVAIVEADSKPPLQYDLVYLTDNRLMLWDHSSMSQEALVNQVITYTLSADSSQIALLRSKGITANGIEMFDLERVELATGQIQILVDDTPRISSLSFSPDQQWLAYSIPGDDYTIHLTANTGDLTRRTLASCQSIHPTQCTELIWSAKSRDLAWSDREGLWLYSLSSNATRLILPARATIPDPRGSSTEVSVRYQNINWSPFGRYILCEVVVPSSDVRWWGIADTVQDRLALLPDSFTTQPPRISVVWAEDGKLFVTQPSHFVENQQPAIELWNVLPTRSDLLLLDQRYTLPPMEIYTSQQTVGLPDFSLEQPYQANEYFFYLAAYTTGVPVLSALVRFDLRYGILEKTNDLLIEEQTIQWAPDGRSLLIGNLEPKWIVTGESTLYDLRAVFGAQSCCFTWLPTR